MYLNSSHDNSWLIPPLQFSFSIYHTLVYCLCSFLGIAVLPVINFTPQVLKASMKVRVKVGHVMKNGRPGEQQVLTLASSVSG